MIRFPVRPLLPIAKTFFFLSRRYLVVVIGFATTRGPRGARCRRRWTVGGRYNMEEQLSVSKSNKAAL